MVKKQAIIMLCRYLVSKRELGGFKKASNVKVDEWALVKKSIPDCTASYSKSHLVDTLIETIITIHKN